MPRPVPFDIHGHLVAKAIEVSNDDPSIAIQAMCFAIVHMALIGTDREKAAPRSVITLAIQYLEYMRDNLGGQIAGAST